MKKYSLEKFKEKRRNKKMTTLTVITLIAILLLIIISLYMANREFRSFIDKYILRKEIYEENANSITIDTENTSLIYAYDKNLAIYTDGNINFYNSNAKQVSNIEITLSKPIADSAKNYLALGDYGSQKICLVKDNELVWQKDIEGKVSKIAVNKEGYMAVSVTGTTYESIVLLYNEKGELQFSKYISTYVVGLALSEYHQYLGIAEIDNSGISPSTKIEMVSVELAKNNKKDATVNSYQAEANEYLSGIKFQTKDNLICCFDQYILKLNEKETKKIYELSDLTAYIDINMSESFARVDKEASSVFKSDYRLKIRNTNGNDKVYIIEGNLINLKSRDDKIALNLGNEVQFINSKGWLEKRYISSQEIYDVVVSEKLGVIIYKTKIDLVSL